MDVGTWTPQSNAAQTQPEPSLDGLIVRFSERAFSVPPAPADSFLNTVLRWQALVDDSLVVTRSFIGMENWRLTLAATSNDPAGTASFSHDQLGHFQAQVTARAVPCGSEVAVAEYDYR